MKKWWVYFPACAILASAALAAEPPAPGGTAILNENTLWRVRAVREMPEHITTSGKVGHFTWRLNEKINLQKWLSENPTQGWLPEDIYTVTNVPAWRLPEDTPAGWMAPEFDDSAWARQRTPVFRMDIGGSAAGLDESWKTVLMRVVFEVTDPARAGELKFSADFRGGLLVYLNGEEAGRAFMGPGPADLFTPAETYPDSVDFTREGFSFGWRNGAGPPRDQTDLLTKRWRKHEMILPAAKLKKGVNVLALAFPRSPTTMKHRLSRTKGFNGIEVQPWGKTGVRGVRMEVTAESTVKPNTGPLPGRGFQVWNQSIIQSVFVPDYPVPFSPLAPIRLTGVKNGTFAGQVVVGDEKPITGLKAAATDLKGPGGVIPASAVKIRYARADGVAEYKQPAFFDSLEEFPPDEVPVYPAHGGSVQPLWITAAVPASAKPGEYTGAVTVSAAGVAPATVPVILKVMDWTLPDSREFTPTLDLIQSPESVAMAYDVPLWSDAHFKLLDRTFAVLAPLAEKTLFITAIRRTHFGNEHAMVRWTRNSEGDLTPDFSIVERYLDVAVKHLGKIPGVILYCWEPLESQGHASGAGGAGRMFDKPILYTLLDPRTGKVSERQGPAWGTPEAAEFWKKVTDGLKPILQKRGLENSLFFGLIGDARPTKQAMDDICNAVPGAKWAVHSHYYCDKWHGYAIGYAIALWGIGADPCDPDRGYSFGWTNPFWLAYYPREMKMSSTLVEHRVKLEKWIGAKRHETPFVSKGYGPRGLGRIGADFWPVLKDEKGRVRGSLAGRYPESAWGQLNLNFCIPAILGRGKDGAVPTVRSEAFRETLQEVEARIYIEKALLDDDAKPLLGDELLGRCRKALDERIRVANGSDGEGELWYISSDWNKRGERLFGLAAEVAAKYGGKLPNPNILPQPLKR